MTSAFCRTVTRQLSASEAYLYRADRKPVSRWLAPYTLGRTYSYSMTSFLLSTRMLEDISSTRVGLAPSALSLNLR